MVKRFGTTTYGAHVMLIKDYLHNLWPDLTSAHQLCDSLTAVSAAKTTKGDLHCADDGGAVGCCVYFSSYVHIRTGVFWDN